uniref:Uncharacterized protein n=1 Tax=Schistocephalus solidus TaxID=70667 RepID=A0A0X3PXN1_SCHSO
MPSYHLYIVFCCPCTVTMKRKYYGIKRCAVYKRVLRAMQAYYAATKVADGPSPYSSWATYPSPEPQMPEIFPEVSNGRFSDNVILSWNPESIGVTEQSSELQSRCFCN